jgi:hypothetical protein
MSSGVIIGGVIGPQTLPNGVNTPGNRYEGLTGSSGVFHHAATYAINSPGSNYDFFVNLGVYYPGVNLNTGVGSSPILPSVRPEMQYYCPEKCYNYSPSSTEYTPEQMEQILNSMPSFASIDELTKWLMEKGLYQNIKENPSLLDSSVALQNFKDSTEINNKGKFGEVSLALYYIYNDSSQTLTTSLIQSRISDAEAKNDVINPQTVFESNQKVANSIILATVTKGVTEFTSGQQMDLEDIANQCPFTGGPAVYDARALLLIANPELIWVDEDICSTSSLRISHNKPKLDNYFKIFPNPASTSITVKYDFAIFDKARLEIYDADGKALLTSKLDIKSMMAELDISNFNNGVYFVKVIGDDETIRVEKLTVVK